MWLTSNAPAACRTASCSSLMDEYCSGISQPLKGTSRAPAPACAAWSGVRLSSTGSVPTLSSTVRRSAGRVFADPVQRVEVLRIEICRQLLVMALPGILDGRGDIVEPVRGPAQTLAQLARRRLAVKLAAQGQLGLFEAVRVIG